MVVQARPAQAETSFADRRNAAVEGMSNALRAAISSEMKWYERYVACIAKGSTKEGALDEVPDAGKTLFQAIDSCARLGLHSQATAASRALDRTTVALMIVSGTTSQGLRASRRS